MMVMLPKINAVNVYVDTAIMADAVTGIEPRNVTHKGKTYKGCKVYTKNGAFKCLLPPDVAATAIAASKNTGAVVGTVATHKLKAGQAQVFMVQANMTPALAALNGTPALKLSAGA